jgi:hypothetical protein
MYAKYAELIVTILRNVRIIQYNTYDNDSM